MTKARSTFVIPAQLLPQLQAFVKEICEQSVEAGKGAVLLSVDHCEKADVGVTKFHVRLIGRPAPVKLARELCMAAEDGRLMFPQPTNPNSRAVGQPGEKITAEVRLYSIAKFNGWFGLCYIYRFRDTFGNELSWKTYPKKKTKKYGRGDYVLAGKVKEHVAEGKTMVTRVYYVSLREKVNDKTDDKEKDNSKAAESKSKLRRLKRKA